MLAPNTLRDHVERRASGLYRAREPYDDHAVELARFLMARLNRNVRQSSSGQNAATDNKKGWWNAKLYNARAVKAFEILAHGMSAGLCSPSQPWFALQTEDPDLMEFQPVKEWLDLCEQQVNALLARCGFYPAATSGFLELGVFGTECCFMTPHWEQGAACFPEVWGSYWLGQNDANRVDSVVRKCDMTVAQLYAKFPDGTFSQSTREKYDRGDYDQVVQVRHLIEPNREREYGRMDGPNKPYRSVYWEPQSPKVDGVISNSGFDERPFWAPRWDAAGGDVYGRSPGMLALPGARKLQLQELRKQQAMDYVIKPPVLVPTTIQGGRPTLNPGSTIASAPTDMAGVGPIWTTPYQAIGLIGEDIGRTEQEVDACAYVPVFQAFTNMDGGAYKNIELVARKHEEQLTQLGPVVDRAVNEKLEPAVEQAFNICLRSGLLPPAPEELQGQPIKIQFHGVLAQAQRLIGLGAIERTAAFIGNLAPVFPEIVDKWNADEAVDQYATAVDISPKIIRSDEAVAEIREGRATEKQQERMAAMMPAVKDGADAARLLSEADTGGGRTVLQNLAQGLQV